MLNIKFFAFVQMYKKYDGNDFDKICETLSKLKNAKLNLNKNLIEKNKDKLENPDFEQDYQSSTAIGIYKIGYDSIKLLK